MHEALWKDAGAAIQLAGEVRARGAPRRVHSVWMAVERERGNSVLRR